MKPSEIKSIITSTIAADVPIHLRSQPGQGKSAFTQTLVPYLNAVTPHKWSIITIHLAQLDSVDVKGYLIPDTTGPTPLAVYTKPHLIHLAEQRISQGADRVIVFFDERGQADALVQKAVAPIILDKCIGEFCFPKGTYFISASNRLSDRAGVSKELTHLTNREINIDFDMPLSEWLEWAKTHGIHEMLQGFIQFRPGVIMQDAVPSKPGPYATLRSFTFANDVLLQMSSDGSIPTDDIAQELVAGLLGEAASGELFAFMSTITLLPTWEAILSNPKKAKVPPPKRLDAHYAVSAMLTSRATMNTLDAVMDYTLRLNVEMQTSTVQQIAQSLGGGVLSNAKVSAFITTNAALVKGSLSSEG